MVFGGVIGVRCSVLCPACLTARPTPVSSKARRVIASILAAPQYQDQQFYTSVTARALVWQRSMPVLVRVVADLHAARHLRAQRIAAPAASFGRWISSIL